MGIKVGVAAALLAAVAFFVWHPARSPIVQSIAPSPQPAPLVSDDSAARSPHRGQRYAQDALIVYVAGAVKRPGLYRLQAGDRDAHAVELAGGFSATADAGGVNLAARASDGDEIYVPALGETYRTHSAHGHGRRHARLPRNGSVDVNNANTGELAEIPGIGRSIAQRIVELREREGGFTSLDQLLDVAGMTQTRLDRALPYLREP